MSDEPAGPSFRSADFSEIKKTLEKAKGFPLAERIATEMSIARKLGMSFGPSELASYAPMLPVTVALEGATGGSGADGAVAQLNGIDSAARQSAIAALGNSQLQLSAEPPGLREAIDKLSKFDPKSGSSIQLGELIVQVKEGLDVLGFYAGRAPLEVAAANAFSRAVFGHTVADGSDVAKGGPNPSG